MRRFRHTRIRKRRARSRRRYYAKRGGIHL